MSFIRSRVEEWLDGGKEDKDESDERVESDEMGLREGRLTAASSSRI
jgi:hypothetical protein